ncbi:MAG: GUN4 domain-containing protein [Cylindrospermopsis raciborskii KL1]|uniref:GUN4 domain-containing protein n=1 Tax=Cylindrospermopsis raciborskii TaxID=77022 RepID=UPI001A2C1175|nr:GUN4 domain-containing protein [Cylindrospermopsis raciborskii]MBG0744958.1 GUN4 domain-containing protein [Cylindrospermopsis raciborskii KL1]
MAVNWAIVVGISNYYNLQKLDFAESDAKAMEHWFRKEANFDEVYLFTEESDPIPTNSKPIPTNPTYGTLKQFLRANFEKPLLKQGDNLWFFFSGHGQRYQDKDYLMLKDTDPGNIGETAISVEYVTERLRRSGADNVILLLDACRNQGAKHGLGYGEEQYQGVITFYSCKAEQEAWEIPELGKGSFTHVLLEGLRLQGEGNCATVERLYGYLTSKIPQLNKRYGKQIQNPYLKAEPPYKMYYPLLPRSANNRDILPLKYEAQKAVNRKDFELAKKLWIRVLAVDGTDNDAVSGIEEIAVELARDQQRKSEIGQNRNKDSEETQSKSTVNTSGDTTQSSEPEIPEASQPTPIEYKKLENLLQAQNFEEADLETEKIILAVAKREKEGWLRIEDAEKFPCDKLRSIDQLWLKYSGGKFGISVQQQIYQSLGGTANNKEIWESMGDRVGWRQRGKWLSYSSLNFSQTAPSGHLPSRQGWVSGGVGGFTSLLSRHAECNT